jgi:hypothetical protein
MALKKLITEENGIQAKYWKIKEIKIIKGNALVRMLGFVNADFRGKGEENFVLRNNFSININSEKGIYQECYEGLKQLEIFENAEDC